jgi:hypothetical protein
MSRVERDPERGRAAAARLKALGVKGILIKAAEHGYITQLACKMPECFCPEEPGGACYFEPVTDELSDWMPTQETEPPGTAKPCVSSATSLAIRRFPARGYSTRWAAAATAVSR